MLSIKQDFTINDIQKDFAAFADDIKQGIVDALIKTLHDLVDTARAKTKAEGSFNNITFNLRASIGGVVMADHKVVETYFPQIGQGEEGREKGINYATEIAHLQDDGEIILVFVAGENYSYYVEAREDTDVISGTSKFMNKFLQSYLGK